MKTRRWNSTINLVLAFFIASLLAYSQAGWAKEKLVLSTGSPYELGLIDALAKPFEAKYDCKVEVVKAGSGKAIKLVREGTVEVTANQTTYINWSLTYAPEQTVTIQPGETEGIDAYVYEDYPTTNFGEYTDLYAGANPPGICRSYLQFSLDSVPEDVVITNAKLWLYYFYNDPGGATIIGVYPVLAAWTESGVTWDDQPEFGETPIDTYNLPAAPTGDFRYWVITDLVRGWLGGSIVNYGLVLASPNEGGLEGWIGFYSSDASASLRPKLTITYYDPTP